MDNNLLTTEQLLEYAQISRATLNRYREEGLPTIKMGRSVRFLKVEVMNWIKDQTEERKWIRNRNLGNLFNRAAYFNDIKEEAIPLFAATTDVNSYGKVMVFGYDQSKIAKDIGKRISTESSWLPKNINDFDLKLMCYLIDKNESLNLAKGQNEGIIELTVDQYWDLAEECLTTFRDIKHIVPLYKDTIAKWMELSHIRFIAVEWNDSYEERKNSIVKYINKIKNVPPINNKYNERKPILKDPIYFKAKTKTYYKNEIDWQGKELLVNFGQYSGGIENIKESFEEFSSAKLNFGQLYGQNKLYFDVYLNAEKDEEDWAEIDKGIWLRISGMDKSKKSFFSAIKNHFNQVEEIEIEIKIEPNHAKRVIQIYESEVVGPTYYDMANFKLLYSYR